MSLDDIASGPISLGDEPLNINDEDLLEDPLVEEVVSDEFSLLTPIETEDDKDDMGLDDLESYD
ncbi:MAG: hypothetical protein K8Q91_00545 [Candidatus Vogelbacteria bacterium]|nr:hypothetical protein [Candidatus Vogelbacteria bacterium]